MVMWKSPLRMFKYSKVAFWVELHHLSLQPVALHMDLLSVSKEASSRIY
jgi:hypothetical protein